MKQTIMLKISGELFSRTNDENSSLFDLDRVQSIVAQIKEISSHCFLGIVLGGGNFFRGSTHGKQLGISQETADEVGMLATIMNAKILANMLEQAGLRVNLLSALPMPTLANPICSSRLANEIQKSDCTLFAGGLGIPSFTTDTNAVLRAIHSKACAVWKATKVDGVYSDDPEKNPHATFFKSLSYEEAIAKKLKVMDQTALLLAQENALPIRVFNLFKDNALIQALTNTEFGSTVS